VRPGSQCIGSNIADDLRNVAFMTFNGSKVLTFLNNSDSSQKFNIEFDGEVVTSLLESGSVGT